GRVLQLVPKLGFAPRRPARPVPVLDGFQRLLGGQVETLNQDAGDMESPIMAVLARDGGRFLADVEPRPVQGGLAPVERGPLAPTAQLVLPLPVAEDAVEGRVVVESGFIVHGDAPFHSMSRAQRWGRSGVACPFRAWVPGSFQMRLALKHEVSTPA